MRVLGVIPARLGSTRLPNKPLQLLAGEPLISRVIERAHDLRLFDQLVVATDSEQVVRAAERAGAAAVVTDRAHPSGTHRVAEVAGLPQYQGFELIVNLQGDEPFIPGEAVSGALARLEQGEEIGTAACPLDPEYAAEPSRVKVVTDTGGRALYFSRAAIPFSRAPLELAEPLYWQHLGIYAYTRPALERWIGLPACAAEQAEQLEQLRALYHGLTIGVAKLEEPVLPGVDTLEDLRRAEAHWYAFQGQVP